MKQCLVPALIYDFLLKLKQNMIKIWLLNHFFYECGDKVTSVATFVATLMKTLDAAELDSYSTKQTVIFSMALRSVIILLL